MNTLTVLILLAVIATAIALATGVASMARGGEFDRRHSYQFMFARVGLQALALLLMLVAFVVALP